MAIKTRNTSSEYLNYLPTIFRDKNSFLDLFLKGFEEVLSNSYEENAASTIESNQFNLWNDTYTFGSFNKKIIHLINQIEDKERRKILLESYKQSTESISIYFSSIEKFNEFNLILNNYFTTETGALFSEKDIESFIFSIPPLLEFSLVDEGRAYTLQTFTQLIQELIHNDLMAEDLEVVIRDRFLSYQVKLAEYFQRKTSLINLRQYVSVFFDTGFNLIPEKSITEFVDALPGILRCLEAEKFIPEEGLIANLHNYFDPGHTPAQLLDWLASWFSLTLEKGDDYNHSLDILERDWLSGQVPPLLLRRESYNRNLIANIFTLYQKRGTREGLEEYLSFYINNASYYAFNPDTKSRVSNTLKNIVEYEIQEFLQPCVVRDFSEYLPETEEEICVHPYLQTPEIRDSMTNLLPMISENEVELNHEIKYGHGLFVGKTTVVHEKEPFYFLIRIHIKSTIIELITKIKNDIKKLIETEKPAHTYYALTFKIDDMKVSGENERIAEYDTLIGGQSQEV